MNSTEKYCTRCKHAKLFHPSWNPEKEKQPTGSATCAFRKGRFGEFSLACEHFIDIDTLLPCPFCGSTNLKFLEGQIIGNRPVGPNRMIRCEDCHVTGPYTLKEAAILHWNKREQKKPTSEEVFAAFRKLDVSDAVKLYWKLEDYVPR